MYNIEEALSRILTSVYGKDVRNAIHDAIYEINEKTDQAVDLSQIAFGTDVTDPTSPVGDYEEGKIYFNTDTGIMWRLSGGSWNEQTHLRAIESIDKTNTSGNVDTYTITFNDGTSRDYTVTNGLQGVSITNITKTSSTDNVDNYIVNLSNGQTTPNGFSVSNGISISNVELDSTVGTTKNYKVKLSDGNYTPSGFSVSDGTSSYVYIRYSASFDGSGMVTVPTDTTVYIGICVTTQKTAPTDPAVYNWVRFIGQSGSGSGDMLKSEYATLYAGAVDKAVALFDGTSEISATQLMTKDEYDTNGLAGTVDKATILVDKVNSIEADTQVLAKFSENEGELQYNGEAITAVDGDTITRNDANELTLASDVTTKLQNIDEQFEVGYLGTNLITMMFDYKIPATSDGHLADVTNMKCCSTDFIKVDINKKYVISATISASIFYILAYSSSKEFIGYKSITSASEVEVQISELFADKTPQNISYIKIRFDNDLINDVKAMFEYSDKRSANYHTSNVQLTKELVNYKVYKSNQKITGTATLKLPCPDGDFFGMLALPNYSASAVELTMAFYTIIKTDDKLHVSKSARVINTASVNNGELTLTFGTNLSSFVKWVCFPM